MGRRAFTLVEMLVVMGVIVFLLGITFSMIAAVGDRAARHQTEVTLRLLETAMQEWETEAGRQLSWWNPNDGLATKGQYEIHADTEPDLIISEMLRVIARVPSVRTVLGQVPEELLYTYEAGVYPDWIATPSQQNAVDTDFDGALTVLDGWGYPIYATHPGGLFVDEGPWDVIFPRNRDGTLTTYNERTYGVCRNRTICFVSAGPDRRHGELDEPPDSVLFQQTRDNIFSYTVDEPP